MYDDEEKAYIGIIQLKLISYVFLSNILQYDVNQKFSIIYDYNVINLTINNRRKTMTEILTALVGTIVTVVALCILGLIAYALAVAIVEIVQDIIESLADLFAFC